VEQNTPQSSPPSPTPVSVVTGATGGIGRWIALGLAHAGHHVVLVGRDPARGEQAIAWIRNHLPDAGLTLRIADLSLLAATQTLGAQIAQSHPAIAVLVNNAGTFCTRRETTAEGHERVIALNHLSPFVLTRALLPALRAADAARIVNIGSSTADHARIDPADLEGKRRWRMVHAYSQSKLALTMATLTWAERLRDTFVTANVVHPGAVATGLVRTNGLIGLAWRAMAPFLLTEEAGAETPLHVALSSEFAGVTGAYVKKLRPVRPNRIALDPAMRQAVWEATEALTK
jgi:NAD(P)-dependent dehydrogenase (short-subunit alcohol dehydrogenase family)